MIVYKLIEEEFDNDLLGHYTSFGINAVDSDTNLSVAYISDVFLDRVNAENYIFLFNEEHLDIMHLENVIDDILHLCWLFNYNKFLVKMQHIFNIYLNFVIKNKVNYSHNCTDMKIYVIFVNLLCDILQNPIKKADTQKCLL